MRKLLFSSLLFLLLIVTPRAYGSDYTITGSTSPTACNGNYTATGATNNGKPVYKHNTANYWISWTTMPVSQWLLSNGADVGGGAETYFGRPNANVVGEFTNHMSGSGTVICSAAGGGGVTVTGKVIMISDDGEGAPSYGYNYDYVSVYPPAQSDTYVKATSYLVVAAYLGHPYYATNPTGPLFGSSAIYNEWLTDEETNTNQRFQIDLGSAKTIKRIYYENEHYYGATVRGVKNFTFWGSNTDAAFADTVWLSDSDMVTEGWTNLTTDTSLFQEHIIADQPDPHYIMVTNTTAYRYYAFKFADNYTGNQMGVRRIELQTAR